ncbi:MAG: tripartite tricarboxylate transporter TctB family protein [Faecalibacterium sp.]|nr:tripartite tricarboxylate transporter TctB family protein [Faecalibacterium sp.]MCI7100814.1 tripartite tricarboxylate transporter TctB family protein [Faecalibacterium sp.]MDY4156913.1 tripartite tricarboxylate transporter TctB family protein [Faecalibacterium sp.]
MKKFKIKTNLVSGILMGAIALLLLVLMPGQVRVPAFDSGAPSPRIIPGICLGIMLVSSIALLIQSLVLKQEKVVEFDWEKEKPAILLIVGMCVYIVLMLCIGYVLASLIVFPLVLFYVGERKPGPYIVVVVSAFAIFLLFKNVFNISLPALGLLGGII